MPVTEKENERRLPAAAAAAAAAMAHYLSPTIYQLSIKSFAIHLEIVWLPGVAVAVSVSVWCWWLAVCSLPIKCCHLKSFFFIILFLFPPFFYPAQMTKASEIWFVCECSTIDCCCCCYSYYHTSSTSFIPSFVAWLILQSNVASAVIRPISALAERYCCCCYWWWCSVVFSLLCPMIFLFPSFSFCHFLSLLFSVTDFVCRCSGGGGGRLLNLHTHSRTSHTLLFKQCSFGKSCKVAILFLSGGAKVTGKCCVWALSSSLFPLPRSLSLLSRFIF